MGSSAASAKEPPTRNGLLAALPPENYRRLEPSLEYVETSPGRALYEPGSRLQHVHFPIEGVVSLLHVTRSGDTAELAVVGAEGVVGVALFMGDASPRNRAVVRSTCKAYRLPARLLKERFEEDRPFRRILLEFTHSLITQISQTAVCNLHHTLDQQLCRWLLLSLDRSPANRLDMTQEMIANMLGVRRQGVTEAARKLERDGLISHHRGMITVLDRESLEKRACECYGVLKAEAGRAAAGGVRPSP